MLKTLFLILNIGCALLLGLTYAIPYINPLEISRIPLLGIFHPILLILNACFLFGWLFTDTRYYSFISIVIMLLGIQHFSALIGLSFLQKKELPQTEVTNVSSYNIRNFQKIKQAENAFQPEAIQKIVEHLGDTNYLCIQEIDHHSSEMLRKTLDFPYYFGERGTKIFSRKPLIDQGYVTFKDSKNSCTWVDVPFEDKTVRLYSVHLESNQITGIIKKIARKKELSVLNRVFLLKQVFSLYSYTNQLRVHQTKRVLDHIEKSPYPVIVCGDFNDSPMSYIYNKFTTQLTDGFMKQGKGLGFSFRSIPFLRIDYILADNSLQFKNYQTVRALTYSDHFPVTASISFKYQPLKNPVSMNLKQK